MLLGLGGIFTALFVIIFLTRRGWKLGWAMLSGSLTLVLFNRLHYLLVLETLWEAVKSPVTINLVFIIITITIFGHLLQQTGSMQAMLDNLGLVIKDLRFLFMFIPALAGLLMVPGGAALSAPMVDQTSKDLKMTGETAAAANVFFRHLLFLVFPFFPGLLLMSEMSGVDVYFFVYYNIPVLVLALVATFFYFFRGTKKFARGKVNQGIKPELLLKLFVSIFPFFLVLLLGLLFNIYFPLALLAGILYVVVRGNPERDKQESWRERLLLLLPGINWSMVLAILGIMVFKGFVQVAGSLDILSVFLLELGVPLLLLAVTFSFFTGVITGNNVASLGMSVPLFLPLLPAGNLGSAYLAAMYVASLAGYTASPFHLCLILSAEYFKASLSQVLKKVALVSSFLVIVSFLQVLFYR